MRNCPEDHPSERALKLERIDGVYPYLHIKNPTLPTKKWLIVLVSCVTYDPNDVPTMTFQVPPLVESSSVLIILHKSLWYTVLSLLSCVLRAFNANSVVASWSAVDSSV